MVRLLFWTTTERRKVTGKRILKVKKVILKVRVTSQQSQRFKDSCTE